MGADVIGELRVGGTTEDNNVADHVCCVCEFRGEGEDSVQRVDESQCRDWLKL